MRKTTDVSVNDLNSTLSGVRYHGPVLVGRLAGAYP